jgi:eukaryotic-like serine/threonine-protein kinase
MGELAEGLCDALAGRYTIERELGRGGMATVYLARDLRHDRPVAFKVLHPELAASVGPERFQREIKLVARLQHPHILTVLDSGEAAGRLWFAMPFVQGESLRDRLTREKQLPVDDALRIAREAADALDYAHQQRIIHRDIKPENILLAGRHALVADFGIARALNASESHSLTKTGMTVGTPTYMSPEQASGEREQDGRTDIYSLGVVLYEMLAGEPPFTGPTAQAMIARQLTQTARPLRTIRETVPEAVERAVAKALAKAPADRYVTAGDFARALEGAAATARTGASTGIQLPRTRSQWVQIAAPLVVGLLIGFGALFGWLRRHNGNEPTSAIGPKKLAVLPFETLGRSEDDYFADGITDEVRGKLAALPGLQVTASGSSAQYKKTTKTPQRIGQELGVQYILVGKVRWEKEAGGQSRVRVSPELVQTSTASTRWQQPFDASLTDVFQVQADVASRVAQALDVALGAGEKEAMAGRPTANLSAYDLYLQGNEAAGGFDAVAPVRLRRAIDFYERAVALDSTFALAWAQLSRAHTYIHWVGVPTLSDDAKARASAERALAIAPNLPEGHLALGDYYNLVKKAFGPAREEYSTGRRLGPNNAELTKGVGLVARSEGRWEESQAALTQAQALDPRSLGTARRLTYNLMRLRRHPETLAQADRALELNHSAPDLHQAQAMVFLQQGDLSGARAGSSKPPSATSSRLRSSRGWRPTTICSGHWTTTSSSSCCACRLAHSTMITCLGVSRSPRRTPCAATRPAPARTETRPGSPERRSCMRRRMTASSTCFRALPSPTPAVRRRRSRQESARPRSCRSAGTPTRGPISSISWRASISWPASPKRRSTTSNRCSGSRTSSRLPGCGSTRPSIRCGRIRGLSGS